jgi:hypothetical protein
VTKHINASTRMVLDSLRTLVIWAFSMGVQWEQFCYVQVIGFVVLLSGTVVYNELVRVPGIKYAKDDGAGGEEDVDEEDSYARLIENMDGVTGSLNGPNKG